jgi:NADH:ubiquinone oxidoreductase subunit C
MTNEDLQNKIALLNSNLEFTEEASEFLNITVPKEELHKLCADLKSDTDLSFDYLFCMTGIDYGKELGVIYHLESIKYRHQIVVKVKNEDRENPVLDSVTDIWKTAEFNEMEIFNFFGIKFNNHPNLKRLFLTPDWNGFPLRKDYVDTDNMVVK